MAETFALTHGIPLHDGARGHPGQTAWLKACYENETVVITVGRRSGKTTFVRYLLIDEAARTPGIYTAAYVAQGHPQAKELFDKCLRDWTAAHIVAKPHASEGQDRYIDILPFGLNSGARVYFISGDKTAHSGFLGKGLNRAIIDEAVKVPEECWTITISKMLTDKNGKAVILSSPYSDGEGWAWVRDLYKMGQPGRDKDPYTLSFNAPTECNPFIPTDRIVRDRKKCRTKAEELTQYDGLFVEDSGAVFDNLPAVFCTPLSECRQYEDRWVYKDQIAGHVYVAGIDFAKWGDYTVVSVFDRDTNEQVCVARFQGPYMAQMPEIDKVVRAYGKPWVYVEGREAGTVLTEMMAVRYGDLMREVKWGRGGTWDKESAVFRGIDLCQRAQWRLIDIPEQHEEFRLYSRRKRGETQIGFHYEAPLGKHDDFVAAALYAAYGLEMKTTTISIEPEKTPALWTGEWVEWVRESQGLLPQSKPLRVGMNG